MAKVLLAAQPAMLGSARSPLSVRLLLQMVSQGQKKQHLKTNERQRDEQPGNHRRFPHAEPPSRRHKLIAKSSDLDRPRSVEVRFHRRDTLVTLRGIAL